MKWRGASVLLLGLLISLPAQAQTKAALEVIPDDAIGYVLINNAEQLNDKIQAMAKKMNTPLPLSPLGLVKTLVGVEKGINEKGAFAIALLDDDDEPIPVLCIPVSSYNDVMSGLGVKEPKEINEVEVVGKSLVIARKGDYLLATEAKNKAGLQAVMSAKKSVAAASAGIVNYLSDNDLAAVITHTGVKKLCSEAKKGLGELKNQAQLQPPFAGDYVEWINTFVKSAETEIPNVAMGLKIDAKHNIIAGMRVDFKPGGTFAKAGAEIKPLPGGNLQGLPDAPAAFAFGGVYPESFLKSMLEMNTELLKTLGQLEKKDIERLQESYAMTAKGMRGMAMSVGVIGKNQAFMETINAVAKVNDADEYISNYVKAMEVTGEIYKKAENLPFPAMKAKSIKVGDAAAALVEMDMSKTQQLGENEKRILDRVLGEGGKLNVTMIAADKNTVLMRYTGAKEAEKALEAYKKNAGGLNKNEEIAKTAAMLPQGSQWELYLGPKEIMDVARRLVDDFAPGAIAIPDFPQTPPIGVGAEISAPGFELRLVVPSAVIEALGKFVKEVQNNKGFL